MGFNSGFKGLKMFLYHWLAFWNPARVWIGIILKWEGYTWDLALGTTEHIERTW